MRQNIREVAKRAQVSAMTVSRVLNGQDNLVLPGTRERVLQAVREMEYVPIPTFVQNRTANTRVVGVVFDHSDKDEHPLDEKTFQGLRVGLRQHEFDMLVLLKSHPFWAVDREEARFLNKQCDGFIFINPRERRELFQTLRQHNLPLVACYSNDVPPGVATVTPDNRDAARKGVGYLVQQGHQRIACFAGPSDHTDARQRRDGYRAAMQEFGLGRFAHWIVEGGWGHFADERNRAFPLLNMGATAVICGNDYQAMALWQVAEEQGIRIPQDLSIIGMDDIPEAASMGLTTLTNPFATIGRAAVEAFIDLLNGADPVELHRTEPVILLERQSVAIITSRTRSAQQ